MTSQSLHEERARILHEMTSIDQMIRGHVSSQTYQVQRAGQTVTQGPYYVLQRHQDGRNLSTRINEQEVELISRHVLAYKRYMELAERYAALSEQLTWQQQDATVKKKFRRFWPAISPKRPAS